MFGSSRIMKMKILKFIYSIFKILSNSESLLNYLPCNTVRFSLIVKVYRKSKVRFN